MFGQLPQQWTATSARSRIAAIGALLVTLAGAWFYFDFVDWIYPSKLWLFWRVVALWFWVALFSTACTSFGQFLLWRVLRLRTFNALESAVFAMSSGVVAFGMAMYVAGALGWYNKTFAVLLPVAMIGAGARDLKALALRLWEDWHAPEPRRLSSLVITAAGVLCLGIIYLGVFSPDSLNYDAAWSHQVIAQEYARAGRIVPFIADYNRNVPHLASLIYTWGYLVPGFNSALKYMLSLHNEFALFLWTLAAVSASVRAMVDDTSLRRTWVSFFLFPIIFVYDNNLGGASDHVTGFFSIPVALAALRLCETFSPGAAALFAIVSAGAALTKFQALFLVLPAGIVVAVFWLWQLAQNVRFRRGSRATAPVASIRDLAWAPFIVLGLGVALFSAHAIRNYVFYNNPVYPFAQDFFTNSTPTVPNAAFLVSHGLADPLYQPTGTLFEIFWHACKLFFWFSFEPHYSFTRDQPAFGSLFTLLFPCVFFVRSRRLWIIAAIAGGAVMVWGMIYNVDRNLQTFMPVLVCVTAALVVAVWRLGWIARLGLVPLVFVQLSWGSDALFYSQHERIKDAMDLIRTGYEGDAHKRFARYRHEYLAMGKATPPDARILMHSGHVTLGIHREVLLDGAGFQGLIHYNHITTPRELYDYFKGFGITHIIDDPGGAPGATSQEEVVFDALVGAYIKESARYGGYRLSKMPEQPPPMAAAYVVASVGQWGYKNGLYGIQQLNTIRFLPEHKRFYEEPREHLPEDKRAWPEVLAKADAAIVQKDFTLDKPSRSLLAKQFTVVRSIRNEFTVYLKNVHLPGAAVPTNP